MKPTLCQCCGRDSGHEAARLAGELQFGGYNPMSIQYAQPWSEEAMHAFLETYVCESCRLKARKFTQTHFPSRGA